MNSFFIPLSIRFISFLVLMVFLNVSCKKESSNPGSSPVSGSYILKGKVLSENGSPLEGARVQCGTVIATSASDGSFTLENVKSEKSIISIEITKTGFFRNLRNVPVEGNSEYYTEATLLEKQNLGDLDASTGGIISSPSNDFQIVAPPNSFSKEDGTPFTGMVSVASRYVKWTDYNLLSNALPGGDLSAENGSGISGTLEPFGLIATEFTSTSGTKVLPSSKIKIKFIIPQNPFPGVPSNCCLIGYGIRGWIFQNSLKSYIDPAPGFGTEPILLWESNPDGGYYLDVYFGDLCLIGKFFERSSVKGKVVCKSTKKPIEFAEVILSSPSKGIYKTHTNKNGDYFFRSVIVDQSFSLTSKGASVQVNSLTSNQLLTAPSIEAECSPIQTIYATWSYNGQTYKSDKFFILNSTNPNCSKKTLLFNDTKNANALKFDYFDFSLGAGQSMQVDSKIQSCNCCCRPSAGGNPAFVDCVEGSITMGTNKTFSFNLKLCTGCTDASEAVQVTGSGTFP